jgi:hypothetical protein
MSDAGEILDLNDRVFITVDIEDCPFVEFPLCELFDLATSTLIDDYLEVLQDYVTQVLEDTAWLDKQCKLRLCNTVFGVFDRRADGRIFSMRKPSLQRRIAQTLRRRRGSHHPMHIPLFICFLLPAINLPPRRSTFPVAIPSVYHADLSQAPSPTTLQLPIPLNDVLHDLGNSTHDPGAVFCSPSPVLADSCGALLVIQKPHDLPHANATAPHDDTTSKPIVPAPILDAPCLSDCGVLDLNGCDIATEGPALENTTMADDVGISSFMGRTLPPTICPSPASINITPFFLVCCEMEKASSASVAIIVGVALMGQHGLFMEGMHVTKYPAPSYIVRIILAPMGPGTLRKYAIRGARSGLPMKDSPLFCDHLHTVPEMDPTTTEASSYGFLLPGNDTGIRRRLSLPRLLTKYQPIDRGR